MSGDRVKETGAEVVARVVRERGSRFAFGVPGGEVLALVAALEARGVRVLTARHEGPAGFMGEGTFHAEGTLGVLVATIGPGAANTVNVAANALQDRVPLLIVTGAVAAPGFTHQVVDHCAFLGPVTKRSVRARRGSIEADLRELVAIATSEPLGPVHLDLPVELAEGEEVAARAEVISGVRRSLDRDVLARMNAELARAERPLLIAGLEVATTRAEAALRRFVERTALPVVTTYKAKGVVDERQETSLGAAGLSPKADALLSPLVRQADVVVLVGYDPIEMRRPWQHPFAPTAKVLELRAADVVHGMHEASLRVTGDLAEALEALTARPRAAWSGEPERTRHALEAAFAPETDAFGPYAAMHAIAAALPDDAVVTVDTGAHRIALSQALRRSLPRTLLQSAGFCTMGYALPVAIGHALAAPERPVVAVMGDGGLEMTLGELLTARDLGVRLPIVVIDDASLALIELKQRAMGLPNAAVDSGRTDHAAVARAMGLRGLTATSAAALTAALRDALTTGGPTLIHVPIARRSYDGRL